MNGLLNFSCKRLFSTAPRRLPARSTNNWRVQVPNGFPEEHTKRQPQQYGDNK